MFHFQQFTIQQNQCAMKVTETACIQGAWTAIPNDATHVLDIGFGTGLLSLMLAQQYPNAQIDAVEIDEQSFLQGSENIQRSPFANRIKTFHADIRNFKQERHYDFVIINPPFFEHQLKPPNHAKKVAWHSEQLSLHELLYTIQQLLHANGLFSLLLPYSRLVELENMLLIFSFHINQILFIQHSKQHEIKFFIAIISCQQTALKNETLIVKDDKGYSVAMKNLMKDFYLSVS